MILHPSRLFAYEFNSNAAGAGAAAANSQDVSYEFSMVKMKERDESLFAKTKIKNPILGFLIPVDRNEMNGRVFVTVCLPSNFIVVAAKHI